MQVNRSCALVVRRHFGFALGAVAAAALVACGGGGGGGPAPAPVAVSGVVADGPLSGATVCYDLNDNVACDSGEPSATTDADGRYAFDIEAGAAGRHGVVAHVPATAIDKDTGQPVGVAFTLKAPASGNAGAQQVFVSPLTLLVAELSASRGITAAEAAASVQGQLALSASPMIDYVAAGDAAAAKTARSVNTVITEVAKLADAAGVSAAQRQALIASVSSGDLSTLAALIAGSSASTPAAVAAEVAAAVLAENNLNASTVAEQAQLAAAVTTPPPASPPGPFVSVRRFAYTDANNYFYQAFVGDSSQLVNGAFIAGEARVNIASGAARPFNRNTAYWNRDTGAWEVCAQAYQLVRTKPQTATTPQDSLFCGGSRSLSRLAELDVSGRRMADVVAEIRASSLRDLPGVDTDSTGLPVNWGPNPALLGDAVFPPESRLNKREQTSEVGDTDRYSLTDIIRVVPASGSGTFRQAVTLEDAQRMSGNLVNAAAVVSNLNTLFVDDVPFTQSDATLSNVKRWRVALLPGGTQARFFTCDVLASNNTSQNCVAAGEGSYAITTQADSRVLRFAGYPAALTTGLKRQRILVERSGGVFGGYRDLERKHHGTRPNTTAWNALRTTLGLPETVAPAAPAGPGPFDLLRSFTFADAANYNWRTFNGDSSLLDAQGYFLANEVRGIRSGGVDTPFQRNALYWTGSEWFDCGNSGVGINRVNSVAPFDSLYCQGYADERHNSVTVTLNGTRMSDAVNNIRYFSSKDGAFDYANWGPNPALQTQLANTFFPDGATMEYRGLKRKATPIVLSTAANSQVRVPPADASVPFNTWPFALSLDEFVAKYPGDLLAGPLNGATAFFVASITLAAAPAPEFTNQLQWRVAFDANGSKARFYSNNILASNGFTTNYMLLLDTTYTVETVGGKRVMKFAAMPAGLVDAVGFERMFAEHAGGVWYSSKDPVGATANYSVRLNSTAKAALFGALGIN